jgi:tetratricopeptide (TPR) repeat protein/cold shock CspA family protein
VTTDVLEQAAAAADRLDWEKAADLLIDGPRTDEALDLYGWYCSRAKRYDDAIAVFTELQQRRPNDYLPPYMLGFQYYQQQQWAESLPHFDRALQLRPDHIKSLWRRAHALHRLGDETQSVLTAGRLLRVWTALPSDRQDAEKRRYAQACHLIARSQIRKDPAGAANLLQQALRHDPDDPYHHQQLAKALLRDGRPSDALAAAKQARRLKPGEPAIELQLAECLIAQARTDEALSILRQARRRLNGWFAFKAGRIALEAGDASLAHEFATHACQDRKVRREQSAQDLLTAIRAVGILPIPSSTPSGSDDRRGQSQQRDRERKRQGSRPSGPGTRSIGTVAMLRADRGFGFLVDESGTRRHFRLKGNPELSEGAKVSFVPHDAEKGPAAADVCAV